MCVCVWGGVMVWVQQAIIRNTVDFNERCCLIKTQGLQYVTRNITIFCVYATMYVYLGSNVLSCLRLLLHGSLLTWISVDMDLC